MNALDSAAQEAIRDAAARASADPAVAAVVVYGGERVFAAGGDIRQMQAMSYTDMVDRSAGLQSSLSAVAQIGKPTVAAVTGYALGAGLELALCCDFRVAAEDARLGLPEILLGLIPGAGGTQRLARLVGPARAKDLIFTGRHVRGPEALQLGLVDEVVPAADVLEAARRRVQRYVGGPAYALRAAKEAIDRGLEADLEHRPGDRAGAVRRRCSPPGTGRSGSRRSWPTARARPASRGSRPPPRRRRTRRRPARQALVTRPSSAAGDQAVVLGQDPHGVAERAGPAQLQRRPRTRCRPPSYASACSSGWTTESVSVSDVETRPCTTCTSTSSGREPVERDERPDLQLVADLRRVADARRTPRGRPARPARPTAPGP